MALCTVLWISAGFAQSSTGTITGRVVDATGSPVPGAGVQLIDQSTRDTRRFTTGDDGDFVFNNVQPGNFTAVAEKTGFKRTEKSNLNLTASDRLVTGNFILEVGAVSESIKVVAQGAAIQVESSERSALIDSRQISELMAKGRDVMALLQLLPGAVDDSTGNEVLGQFTIPSMGGSRNNYSALNIDGISGNTTRGKTAESPINMDAIAEVKVLTNSYPAEYGTASGTIINLVTKGGSQKFNGAAYYYNRNEAFNSNNFFNNRQSVARQRYRYNTAGYNIGGPIFWPGKFNSGKQKLFFFFSQEIDPNQTPNSLRNYTVPTELERKGDFSQSYKTCTTGAGCQVFTAKDPTTNLPFANNIVPPSRIDANSARLLTIFPLPNATNAAITKYAYNFQIAGTNDVPALQEILRVDYNISDKARLWTRLSGFDSHNKGLTSPASSNQWGPANIDYSQSMPNLGGSMTYIVSPSLINELTFGLNLWIERQVLADKDLVALQRSTYGIDIRQTYPADNPLNLLPALSFGGVSSPAQVSYDGRFPLDNQGKAISISDQITKTWRSHRFKAGITIQRAQYIVKHHAGNANFPGNFAFAADSSNPLDTGYAYANAFLGIFDTYSEVTNRTNYSPVTPIREWYVQDSWKVNRRVMLDYGVRFTWALPLDPSGSKAANFVPWLWDSSQAPRLFTPAKVNGANVIVNPITGATVPNIYSGLLAPNSGNPTNGVVVSGTQGFPNALVYGNGIIYAPRLGIAWDPKGDGKTAFRMGGGVFYNTRADAGSLGNLSQNPPLIFNPTAYYGYVSQAFNSTGLLSPTSFNRILDPNGKTVTSYHASFGIQRSLGWATVLDAAYVGTFGRHLGEQVQLNNVPYGAQFLPQNQNPQTNTPLNDNYFRPYRGYNAIAQQIFQGNSSYHSLQAKLDRRFAKGVQFGVVYTFSKAMSYAEGDSTGGSTAEVAAFQDRKIWNYSLASYDRPHILTFNFLWDVPRLSRLAKNHMVKTVFDGWQVSNITSFISGQPLTVSMGTSPSVNFVGGGDGARPIMVGNPILDRGDRTFDRYFNVAAFGEPTALKPGLTSYSPTWLNYGNMTRYPIRGPGTSNWNTSLFKNFNVGERLRFQFRAESYNTFNHSQFSGLNTSITFNAAGQNTNAAAGQITAARSPRVMQMALRVNF